MKGRLNAYAKLPSTKGYNDCVIPKNESLQDYMDKLLARSEEIRSGKIDRKWDNMLKVSTDGRKAALGCHRGRF